MTECLARPLDGQGIVASFPDRRVCVLGLGYVGLTLAAVLADVGFTVLGVEPRREVLARLADGRAPVREPGLEELLARVVARGDLRCADRIPADVDATVFIVTVGTPLDERGAVRLDMVENAVRDVAAHLRDGDLVIMRSTVGLGTTRTVVAPILAATGRRFDLAFCPERTVEGQALAELRQLPQIIGGAGPSATVRAAQFFQFLTPAVVRVSDVETAELVKLVDNVHRDVLFGFANEVAAICDAVGVSAREVIASGRYGYPRTDLAQPGPVGGPCLSKDPHILVQSLVAWGITPIITAAARQTNEELPRRVVTHLRRLADDCPGFPDDPVISLLGLAFKGRPATDDLRGTVAAPVLAALRAAFPRARFRGYDPVVDREDVAAFGLEPAPGLTAAFEGANLVLVLNNHPAFAEMPLGSLAARLAAPGVVYDCWNTAAARDLHLPPGTRYVALGGHGVARLPRPAGV